MGMAIISKKFMIGMGVAICREKLVTNRVGVAGEAAVAIKDIPFFID
ncbi:hypothetical protein ACQ86O_21545 [Serratia sp. L9]